MRKKLKPKKGKAILWAIKVDGILHKYAHTEKAAYKYAYRFAEEVANQDEPWHPEIEIIPVLIADEFAE